MKKRNTFNKPEVEIIKFSTDDIITESLGGLGPEDPIQQPGNSGQA